MFLPAPVACPYPPDGVTRLVSVRDLPVQVTNALGAMAEAGAPFEAGDAWPPGPRPPSRRFSHAEGRGCALSVHYEEGGRGYSRPTARFTYVADRWVRAGGF